ncbi:branched-chain amino acid ABC transporter permease [Amycolatopsis sp. K13G38]|uniref:Branched-chain amino acid ABC transporter permease n=1 Tax=Amycolatopsis acididurans TaxID=2724524 RepID=A0ABX1IYR5_9PSEU|nr:branched-chain amino acid ABC transporter permease [Amycolatopsis acididurans]NKQ52653.1 branched-chain amino acid ABC transporter permease [Amycolatopsis acididurans]
MTASQATRPRPAGRTRGIGEWWSNLARPQQWAVLVPVVVLIYFLPVLNPPLLTTEPYTNFPIAMVHAAELAMVAIGLNVVVGQAGLLDLGYVGFFAIGAYVAALFTSKDSMLHKLPYLATLPLAMAVTMIAGVILGLPTLRLRGDYLAIVTLGFGEIVRLLATIVPGLKGQVGFQGVGHPPGTEADGSPIFAANNGTPWYWLVVTLIIVLLLFVGNLERSRVGRAWVAIREDEDAAELMGVPTFKFKLWAFAIGAAIGGLSGALVAGQTGFMNNQNFSVAFSVLYLAAVILGGSGNKVGVLVGAFIVSYIPDRFTNLSDRKYLIFGLFLVVLMIFRPQGLLGARQRLLARGRKAYQRLIGKGEQISSESSVASTAEEGRPV